MAFQHASPLVHRQSLRPIAEDGNNSVQQNSPYERQTHKRHGHELEQRFTSQHRPSDSVALSDFGSFNTLAPSGTNAGQDNETTEDNDLDSLDDGLNAFREPTSTPFAPNTSQEHITQTILPAHDGMGSFPIPDLMVQEQIWQFEKLNPQRQRQTFERRQSGLFRSLDEVIQDEHSSAAQEDTKTQRIERWRLDQSRILLDELQKKATHHNLDLQYRNLFVQDVPDNDSMPSNAHTPSKAGFWRQMTQKVIRDLIGLDDQALSILFGESFVNEEDLSRTPTPRWSNAANLATRANTADTQASGSAEESWTDRILSLLASELDIILHQMNESRSSTTIPKSNDYAGIPATHNTSKPSRLASHILLDRAQTNTQIRHRFANENVSQFDVEFGGPMAQEQQTIDVDSLLTREELQANGFDLSTIVSYLARRLLQEEQSSDLGQTADANRRTAGRSEAAAARVAVIERYHPLVSRYRHTQRMKHGSGSAGVAKAQRYHNLNQNYIKRRSESCASQSTRQSRHQFSDHSRNFWDIGGSLGSESVFDTAGAWGEV